MIWVLSSSHILTNSVKDNDCCIDRITNDRQHAGNKCITYGNSGDCIECKYDQHIMKQCQNCTARKTDILETEPDICKHKKCSYDHGYNRISSHFRAYRSRNTFRCDQTLIHTEFLNQSCIQFFSFLLRQCTGLDNYLICAGYLGRLYILVSGNFLYNRCDIRINLLDIHIFIKCHSCCSSTGEVECIVQCCSIGLMMNCHCNRTTQDQDNGDNEKYFTFADKINKFTLFCTSIEFRITDSYCIQCIYHQSGYHQSCEHGNHDTKSQCICKALNSTGTQPHQNQCSDQGCDISVDNRTECFCKSCLDRSPYRVACCNLFLDTCINDDVGIHCHTNTKNDTGNTRKGKCNVECIQSDQHECCIQNQCYARNHTRNTIHQDHKDDNDHKSYKTG